jgi:hypothetical protein
MNPLVLALSELEFEPLQIPARSIGAATGFEQDVGMLDFTGWCLPFMNKVFQHLSLLSIEFNGILFHRCILVLGIFFYSDKDILFDFHLSNLV